MTPPQRKIFSFNIFVLVQTFQLRLFSWRVQSPKRTQNKKLVEEEKIKDRKKSFCFETKGEIINLARLMLRLAKRAWRREL